MFPGAVEPSRSCRDWPGRGAGRALLGPWPCDTTAVSGDEPQTMRVPDLFDPGPQTWGLRGGPRLWRAPDQDAPASAGELASLLHAAFRELPGTDLTSDPASSAYLEQYAHGGMSSGMISLGTWHQQPVKFPAAGSVGPCERGGGLWRIYRLRVFRRRLPRRWKCARPGTPESVAGRLRPWPTLTGWRAGDRLMG
jgi:hypothetical protein